MKKIMFNDKYGLTQAVLEGRKTMTRRIVPVEIQRILEITFTPILVPVTQIPDGMSIDEFAEQFSKRWGTPVFIRDGKGIEVTPGEEEIIAATIKYAPYKVGELVAVAKAYKNILLNDYFGIRETMEPLLKQTAGWNNKMFVKAEFMPHRIKITDITVERLQDITDAEALMEGIWFDYADYSDFKEKVYFFNDYEGFKTPRDAFAVLIDRISGKGTWDWNPWVFVYTFELA